MRASNRWLTICTVVFITSIINAVAVAEEPAPKVRLGFDVEPELKAKYEGLRAKGVVVPAKRAPVSDVKETFTLHAILVRFDDGMALLGKPVSEAQKQVLMRLGAAEVEAEVDARNHSIFKGTYYRAYQAPEVEVLVMKGLVGAKVKAELVRTETWTYLRWIRRAS